MGWKKDLRGSVLDIVACDSKYIRVVAGPGTGKTFTIKRKIARYLEENVDPEEILVITFTRMAARDLEKEITSLLIPGVEKIRKGTLHSLCLSILNDSLYLTILGRESRILLKFEERFLLEDLGVYSEIEPKENYYGRRKRLRAFEAAWAREQDQVPGWPIKEIDKQFQRLLFDWLLFHNAMIIGETIPLTLKYLSTNPGCVELNLYKYVLVDEYQDLNRAEQHVIDLLSTNANLTIVGDEDQSIFESLKHAHPEGITNFHIHHPGTVDKPLEECRRCPTSLVTLANSLISYNSFRGKHKLLPFAENVPGKVSLVQWDDAESEVTGLANFIKHKVEVGEFDPGKILVLSPRKQFGQMIRNKLNEMGCPAHSYFQEELLDGNPKKLDDSLSQQALTLLKLLLNPNDHVSLRVWLGLGHRNLNAEEYKLARDYCFTTGINLPTLLTMVDKREVNNIKIPNLLKRYKLLLDILNELKSLSLEEQITKLFPEGKDWAEPFCKIIETNSPIESIKSLVSVIETEIIQPEMPINVDFVRVMSLHKSKGLTADHVIVMTCVQGVLPCQTPRDISHYEKKKYEEEQRRLFYVSITRAKKTLVLSSISSMPGSIAYSINAHASPIKESVIQMVASTFLTELGPTTPLGEKGDDWLEKETACL